MSPNSPSPPRQQIPVVHESPVHAKKVHSSRSYQDDHLEEARLAVLHDLGSTVPRVSLQSFMEFLAPPRPRFDIETAMNTLKSMPDPILSSSGRWKPFNKEPKDQPVREDAVFEPMTEIFKRVVDAVIASSSSKLTAKDCSIELVQNPSIAPTSAGRYNATRPDGYLLIKDRLDRENISWADVVLSCEYKRKDGIEELDDDVRKCLWSMQHVMRDDPCRRATFGITIENTSTRVWFCCRSSVVVSEPFDFIAEPQALVELFASFAFADRRSLGFDPTMTRTPGDPMQFIITVHPHHDNKKPRRFRTRQIISSYGAEPLRGRGTRVFEAIEVDGGGNETGAPVVLKDIWIDHDRTREGDILTQLYNEADDEDKKLVKNHFLTTVCHGDVLVEPDTADDTRDIMRGLKTTGDGVFQLQSKDLMVPKREGTSGSQGLRGMTRLHIPHPNLSYPGKTHYRIIFEEKGITIDLVPSLRDVMRALADIVSALQLLRKLGWVHRDVSIGNILWYRDSGKLSDLEYAKRIDDRTSHDTRTGTIHFMSIEVSAQEFLFAPGSASSETLDVEGLRRQRQIQKTLQTNGPAPFIHIHLHDLESLWWVAVWIVFYHDFRIPEQLEAPPDLKTVQHQLDQAMILFPSVMESTGRLHGFQFRFSKICRALAGDLSNKKSICADLDLLRRDLVNHYTLVEAMLPHSINPSASKDQIYVNFRTIFMPYQESAFTLAFIPDIKRELLGMLKRPRAESANDMGVAQKKR